MNRKGFTLVELLAVIVVLAILAVVATPNIINLLNHSKKNTTEIVLNNLRDAATGYVKEQVSLKKINLSSCNFEINDKQTADNNTNYRMSINNNKTEIKSNVGKGSQCVAAIQINALEMNGIFDDKDNSCNKTSYVYVYKYNNGNYTDIKVFIPDKTCEVK